MQLLTIAEVAERLAISERKCWQMAARGDLPVWREGRIVRVPDELLDEWIRSRTETARLVPKPRRRPIPIKRGRPRKAASA